MAQAARVLGIHLATVYRYVKKGIAGEKLETAWAGEQFTSRGAIRDWSERVARAKREQQAPTERSLSERKRADRAAVRKLETHGV